MDITSETNEFVDGLLADSRVSRLLDDLKNHHLESYGHSLRVGKLSVELAKEYSCPNREVLGYGGLLHDVGKTEIRLGILEKEEPLTQDERARINEHTYIGYEKLDEAGFGEQVAEVALYHHEFKKNDNIGNKRPETAEIVSIADVYDALTQDRSYNDGLPEHEAKEIMESEHSFNKSLDWIAEGPM